MRWEVSVSKGETRCTRYMPPPPLTRTAGVRNGVDTQGWQMVCSIPNWDICPVAGCHAPRPQDNPQEDGNG